MRTWLFLGLALVWAGTAQAQQAPGPADAPEGVWRLQIHWVPLDIGGHRYLLYTRVCRPAGEMPARVVVIAHGSPPSPLARPGMKPVSCDSEVARWFLERGFVVVSGMRRGYGETVRDTDVIADCIDRESDDHDDCRDPTKTMTHLIFLLCPGVCRRIVKRV